MDLLVFVLIAAHNVVHSFNNVIQNVVEELDIAPTRRHPHNLSVLVISKSALDFII
jgi:hypothetical protein